MQAGKGRNTNALDPFLGRSSLRGTAGYPRCHYREERHRTRTLQRYAHQSHLQGVLSETHRRLDDQFRKRKRVGKESRFCQAHPFSVLKKLPVKYLPVILSEIPKDFRLPA